MAKIQHHLSEVFESAQTRPDKPTSSSPPNFDIHVRAERRAWLARQYPGGIPTRDTYASQPYEQLAKVLAAQGADDDARAILRDKARIEARLWQLPLAWLYRLFFGGFFGYGLSIRRAVVTFVGFILLGTLLTAFANGNGLLVIDSQPVAALAVLDANGKPKEAGLATKHEGPGVLVDVPCGSQITSWVYATDLAIPLLDLHEETRCTIRSAADSDPAMLSGLGAFLTHPSVWRWGKGLYAVLGWLITSLTVLTVTGVFRRMAQE